MGIPDPPHPNRVRELRRLLQKDRGRRLYGASAVARRVGITPKQLWRIERGEHLPHPRTRDAIAADFGVPLVALGFVDDR